MSNMQEMKGIEFGNHQNDNHTTYSDGYIVYDYNFVLDGDDIHAKIGVLC